MAGQSDRGQRQAAAETGRGETLLRPGHNCWRVDTARRATMLVDGSAYFAALRDALERARRSVFVLGWDFDGDVVLDPSGSGAPARPLRELFPALLDERPELHVRILIWGFSVVYGQSQGLPPSLDPSWPDHPRLHYRVANDHPLGASHHEKVVCIDDALAFCGGMDLTALRWDEPTHDPDHPARVDARGRPYRPLHDVQLAVDGDVASSLSVMARTRWYEVTGERVAPADGGDAWPERLAVHLRDVPVGIARTVPARGDLAAIHEAEHLILDGLDAAREYVYVESQYLTSSAVGERIASLLERPGGPQIVVVTRQRSSGWLERVAMGENRTRLLRRLAAADREGRLRAYYPVARDGEGQEQLIDVHSKLMAVDDRLLKIGSSNMSNRSMGVDSECDLAIEARDGPTREALRGLTFGLLAEHLGRSPQEVATEVGRAGLIAAVERLDGTESRRRLVRFAVDESGPREPLPGSFLVDPEEPLTDDLPFG